MYLPLKTFKDLKPGTKLRSLKSVGSARNAGDVVTVVEVRDSGDVILYDHPVFGGATSRDFYSFALVEPRYKRNLPDWW